MLAGCAVMSQKQSRHNNRTRHGAYHLVENGRPRAIRTIARERLARTLLSAGKPDEAWEVIQGETEIGGFEARYAETRGDILLALGRNEEAIGAYQEALETLEAGAGDRPSLVLKLEALGVLQDDEVPAT
jgi:predicted negative regulator of RcsB-dependent stress response